MSTNSYRCDEAGWNTPKPACTCGAGDEAPWSAHYSRRFGGRSEFEPYNTDSDCALYTWHKGCRGNVSAHQCPEKTCAKLFTFCDAHGGRVRAEQTCKGHAARLCHGDLRIVRISNGPCSCPPDNYDPRCPVEALAPVRAK